MDRVKRMASVTGNVGEKVFTDGLEGTADIASSAMGISANTAKAVEGVSNLGQGAIGTVGGMFGAMGEIAGNKQLKRETNRLSNEASQSSLINIEKTKAKTNEEKVNRSAQRTHNTNEIKTLKNTGKHNLRTQKEHHNQTRKLNEAANTDCSRSIIEVTIDGIYHGRFPTKRVRKDNNDLPSCDYITIRDWEELANINLRNYNLPKGRFESLGWLTTDKDKSTNMITPETNIFKTTNKLNLTTKSQLVGSGRRLRTNKRKIYKKNKSSKRRKVTKKRKKRKRRTKRRTNLRSDYWSR
tara:strand:- start:531 stop:1421 length:891 start_codon:yes stop_codon:yes gene_type:complete